MAATRLYVDMTHGLRRSDKLNSRVEGIMPNNVQDYRKKE
jgi:hypothetical protein